MAQPYIGEIRIFAGNFAPAGWMFCDGQLLPISENETLFQLIGTTYGGDGESTFALPNLQGRSPIHQGNGRILAEAAGVEEVTLTVQQLPAHTHTPIASSSPGNLAKPTGGILAAPTSVRPGLLAYGSGSPVAMSAQSINPSGGSQPHSNFQPYLCLNHIISLFGIFPSPT